jgi:autotransporter-associated beta strand protein
MNTEKHKNGDIQRRVRALLAGGLVVMLTLFAASSFASDNVLSFDEKTDRIATPARITTTDFTVEAWVRMTEQTAENQIAAQYIGGDDGRMIFALKNDRPSLFIAGWLYGTPVDLTNKWTHIAATRSDKTWTIYVNGLLNTTAVKNNELLSDTDFKIGSIGNYGFRGQIADMRIWSEARSQAEIQSTMNVRLAGNETDLSYYWPMNEGSGTTVFDSAEKIGGQADGTVFNCEWITSDIPITSDTTVGAWSAVTGGKWSVPANWLDGTVASGTESTALFTNQPPAAVTITNDLATLRIGNLTVEGASSHTFSGNALTFSNNFARSILIFREGAHTLDLPIVATGNGIALDSYAPATLAVNGIISGAGSVAINSAASGAGIVTPGVAHTYTGATITGAGTYLVETINNGGVAGAFGASTADPANLVLGPGTLHITDSNVITDRGYTLNAGASPVRAAIMRVDGDLTIAGQVLSTSGAFIKSGPGTLRYTYPGENTLSLHQGSYPHLQDTSASGDSPTVGFAGFNINDGTVIMGVPGQTNIVDGRILIGLCTTTNAGEETTGELIINDGTVICGNVGFSWNNGTAVTAGPEGMQSRLIMNGGYLDCNTFSMGMQNSGLVDYNARPTFYQYGGVIEARIRLYLAETAGSICSGTIAGGRFHAIGTSSVLIGGRGEGILTITGDGELEATDYLKLAHISGSKGTLNLDGGTVIAQNIITGDGDQSVVYFNGGVFRPHTASQTMQSLTAAYVSTNGVALDNSMADFIIAQDLLTDPMLDGAKDGGLLKTGEESLTLSSVANTFNGPVRVTDGTLSAYLGGTNDLDVTAGATFDALAANCAVGALSGEGDLINGTITVNGALDCGDSGADAGAELSVANLTMVGGSSYVCDWSTNALGEATCDYVTVGGDLNVTAPGLINFNRELGDPIPMPFEVEIMSYNNFNGSFAGWQAIGTGLPEDKAIATVVTAADGVVTVKVNYGGLLMIVR